MAKKAQDRLFEEFGGLFDPYVGASHSVTEAMANLGLARESALTPGGAAATTAGANVRGGSTASGSSQSSGPDAGDIASTFLESGFGIVPLITGLAGLFDGGSKPAPTFEKYQMPSSISFMSADTGSGLSAADFDQTGAPRVYDTATDALSGTTGDAAPPVIGASASGGGAAGPQITVNVQAMDAHSFMDYSSQIAQAVRGAMLNLSSLNDVVNEL